ncbi:MAG: hypothetical protein E5V62_11685 [Mesorhizobium sp.]|uniref:DMT family transporter n=1 Tax=Mesorhizobium sp. TaxID=1871066 RepID=UPI000FD3DCA0|nr:DMT family transporter [Mesorhizobium sp.]RVD73478.1 hypothetical protein EN751_04595 [Mesorhizobium sp. M4A.F.Ca.ET.029.04.2.1]TIW35364.1 MAG: hypothetical protein E5V62_11685 [Mesorhizobium sp.]
MTAAVESLPKDHRQIGRALAPPRHRQSIGTAMVILSSVAIAVVPSFARLAYDGGSNVMSVITLRCLLTVGMTWILMVSLGQTLWIVRKSLIVSCVAGVSYAVMLFGFLGAVKYIPVNMVILIYFSHPLLVGVAAALLGDGAMNMRMMMAFTAAFAGLGLAIGFSFSALNATGLCLAALGAVTCVFVIVGSARAMRQAGGLAVAFYMMVSATLTLALLFPFMSVFALPQTVAGWVGFAGVAIGSTIGTLAFLCAFPIVGSVRATMISNVEPLLGIVFAVLFLGETISAMQMSGIAMVLAAVISTGPIGTKPDGTDGDKSVDRGSDRQSPEADIRSDTTLLSSPAQLHQAHG